MLNNIVIENIETSEARYQDAIEMLSILKYQTLKNTMVVQVLESGIAGIVQ